MCISGIDTDIGKTVATGLMARALLAHGCSVITQKVAQTGCAGIAEDIQQHRKLMGVEFFPEDTNGLTCPYVFSKPCSPHLAAELDQTRIDPDTITLATQSLAAKYDYVLLEGAGGLMVPLTREMTFLDYLQEQGYPLILVSSPRLGSINHTLSALELAKGRGIELRGIIYNCYDGCDDVICGDSRKVFVCSLQKYGFSPSVVDMVSAESYQKTQATFDCLQLFEI
jgi:dethiobiotin synthetase